MSVSPGGEVREPAVLLLVGAGEEERQRAELLDREDQAARRAGAADLLDREADGQQVAAEAAVLRRERQPEDVVGGEELLDVPRELGRPVDLGGPGRDLLVGQHPDRVAEHLLLLGQAVGPGSSGGGRGLGHRAHRSSVAGSALGGLLANCPKRTRLRTYGVVGTGG